METIRIDFAAVEREVEPAVFHKKTADAYYRAEEELDKYLSDPPVQCAILRTIMRTMHTMQWIDKNEFLLCGVAANPSLAQDQTSFTKQRNPMEAIVYGKICISDNTIRFYIPANVDDFFVDYSLRMAVLQYRSARKVAYEYWPVTTARAVSLVPPLCTTGASNEAEDESTFPLVSWGHGDRYMVPLACGDTKHKELTARFCIQVHRCVINDDLALCKIWDTYFIPEQEEPETHHISEQNEHD